MTQLRTLQRRINGAYDHWKKWRRLRKTAMVPASTIRRGRRHKQHLRSAIAYQLWVMRSRREPFPFLHD